MLKEILEGEKASPEVQKIWEKFDKSFNEMKKALRKEVRVMVVSELDDLEYEMYSLLNVK